MPTQIYFPQVKVIDDDGYFAQEWQEWLQNPQFLTITFQVALDPTSGGTGLTSYTPGDLIAAVGPATLVQVHDVAVGNALLSGGVGGLPAYGKVDLTAHISGILPIANGGTNAANVANARINLGLGSIAVLNSPLGLVDGGTGVISGTQIYTPTLTAVTNVATSTAFVCQYYRVGNVVTVSGRADVDPTAAGQVQLGISLPVPSLFANNFECGGTAFAPAVAGQGAAISADTVNDRAQMEWVTVDTANRSMFFSFTYQVI